LPSYSSGTIQENANEVDIYVGNYLGNFGTQERITTFVLKGRSEPNQPVLAISGQTDYTENWDAPSQTYILNVTHNGPVNISLATSGAQTVTARGLQLSGT
jgi:hypothetical protein